MSNSVSYDAQEFYDGLVAHGLIVPVGVPGAFGRGQVFEDVLERFDATVAAVARADGAEVLTFPPVIDRTLLERSDYMDAFPHLAGTVFSFKGKEAEARRLAERIHAGEPWADLQSMTAVALNPAACYPLYPSFTGVVPEGGRLVTMMNWVFRHEPSPEPTRMQSFRVRELVRVGTPAEVLAWRDLWLERGLSLLRALGLPAEADAAADPFFGRAGKMLAVSQKEQKLKFEVLVPIVSREQPTAVCSFNYHQQHFGQTFSIQTAGGAVAHSACVGFGLERVAMALFHEHGFDPAKWPATARGRLWP